LQRDDSPVPRRFAVAIEPAAEVAPGRVVKRARGARPPGHLANTCIDVRSRVVASTSRAMRTCWSPPPPPLTRTASNKDVVADRMRS